MSGLAPSKYPSPPPGPKGRRLRNMRERLRGFPAFLERLHGEYGDVVSYELPSMRCCAVFAPDLIHQMLVDERQSFPKGEIFKVSDKFITGPGVFTSEGEDHGRRRCLAGQAFSKEHLKAYAEVMVGNARLLQQGWRSGQVIDANAETSRVVRRIAFGVFFGPERQVDQECGERAVRGIKWDLALGLLPFSTLLRKLPLPGNVRAERACAALDEILLEAVGRARAPSPGSDDALSLASLLVNARGEEGEETATPPFTDEEIRNELYILLLANFDPMAASLAWSLDHLSRNPRARVRLEEEVDSVLGDGQITVADYGRLPYSRAVFLEAGRLTPPNYFFDRVAAEDCILGDCLIRKGTVVQPCFSVCHRQEKYWPRAGEFRPERWLDGSRANRSEHAFLMFSRGPRECLGREFATMQGVYMLASIAQRWRLEAVPGRPARADGKLVYVVKGEFPLVVTERSRTPA